MPNFHFTSVHCPDSKRCQLVLTLARTLRSYLDSCHRSTVHQHSIRCERASTPTHPLPNSNFAPCQLVMAGRTPSALPESRHRLRMQRVTRWAPHPRWHELPPPPTFSPSCPTICCLPEQVPVTLHTSLRSAETLGLASQLALPPYPLPPLDISDLSAAQTGPSPRDTQGRATN